MNLYFHQAHIQEGLTRLDELVTKVNDIVVNRVQKNLKQISRTILFLSPEDQIQQVCILYHVTIEIQAILTFTPISTPTFQPTVCRRRSYDYGWWCCQHKYLRRTYP